MTLSTGFEFDGEHLANYGDIGRVVCAIAKAKDREKAKRFTDAYVADLAQRHPVDEARSIVASNIGYLSGYYSPPTMALIQGIFDASHPVFGRRTDVGAEEAFDAGAMMALGIDPQASDDSQGTDT